MTASNQWLGDLDVGPSRADFSPPQELSVSDSDAERGHRSDTPDFDETFCESYGSLVRTLGVACGDPDAAADAVQEAFIRAYARWHRICRYDNPVGWIRHVALNCLRDHFRRVDRRSRAQCRLEAEVTAEGSERDEFGDRDELLAALQHLPRQQRIAVSLYYLEQLSVNEVATVMKLSEGAVKYHLHAGRSALRERLEQS